MTIPSFKQLLDNRLGRLVLLILLSLVLRFLSFFPSVLDHDESTYIVIANALLHGSTYWVDIIDTKPPGIFLLLAGFQFLFGKSIFILRMVTAIWLALTAFFLVETHLVLKSGRSAAFAAGVIYLFLNSLFKFYGVSPNTETYFGLFTIVALWLLLSRCNGWAWLLAGLLLGLGFITKYVVLFDAFAFGLFFLLESFREAGKERWKTIGRLAVLVLGFVLPFAGEIGYYASIGRLDNFLFYTFEVTDSYTDVQAGIWAYLKSFMDFNLRFLPVAFCFYYALFNRLTTPAIKRLGLIWFLAVTFIVLWPGRFYGHYFIQLMLPFSFVAGAFFNLPDSSVPAWTRKVMAPKTGYSLLGLLLIANLFLQKADYLNKPDYGREMAIMLQQKIRPEDQVYIGSHQILYHLLQKPSPSGYIHPSLLLEAEKRQAMQIDLDSEIQQIMASNPRFLVLKAPADTLVFGIDILNRYELIHQTGRQRNINIYERKYSTNH